MAKYTPTTMDVRVAYCTSLDPGFAHKAMAHLSAEMTTGHAADFNRWLEAHDREVQAQALWELAEAVERKQAPGNEWFDAVADTYVSPAEWVAAIAARMNGTAEEPTT